MRKLVLTHKHCVRLDTPESGVVIGPALDSVCARLFTDGCRAGWPVLRPVGRGSADHGSRACASSASLGCRVHKAIMDGGTHHLVLSGSDNSALKWAARRKANCVSRSLLKLEPVNKETLMVRRGAMALLLSHRSAVRAAHGAPFPAQQGDQRETNEKTRH